MRDHKNNSHRESKTPCDSCDARIWNKYEEFGSLTEKRLCKDIIICSESTVREASMSQCQSARSTSEGPEPHNDCKNVMSEV